MKLLSIDTSTNKFSLAISDGTKVIRSRNFAATKILSNSIIPRINSLLKSSGLNIGDIDCFVVGLGPGSFTSLRVGLSTIKAFALTKNKKVIGIPSMDTIAMNVKDDSQICVINDARREMVYACVYEKSGSDIKRTGEYMLASINDVLDNIKGKAIFVGDAIELYKKEIERSNKSESLMPIAKSYPCAKNLALLGIERYKAEKFDDIDKLIPLYLYADDCQVRK
jgi:tRNA threonylcarbamoyladenosine biosynthesis protein TsaB